MTSSENKVSSNIVIPGMKYLGETVVFSAVHGHEKVEMGMLFYLRQESFMGESESKPEIVLKNKQANKQK